MPARILGALSVMAASANVLENSVYACESGPGYSIANDSVNAIFFCEPLPVYWVRAAGRILLKNVRKNNYIYNMARVNA